jgi:ribosome-associated heat shock protein Hsp15
MSDRAPDQLAPTLRLDKWLWYARFFKSRTRATAVCEAGRVRVNGTIVHKAHHALRPGDVLTFPQGADVRIVRILGLGARRGPAPEAQALYEDLEPPVRPISRAEDDAAAAGLRSRGSGRPTKADRRATDRLKPDA